MSSIIKPSVVLAVAVSIFAVFIYVSGLHKNFLVGQIVFLVGAIAINLAVIWRALSQTAAHNTYGKQLAVSAGIGLIGGVLVLLLSWLNLAVFFPNVLAEMREGAIAFMEQANLPEDQVASQMASLDASTPMSQSVMGFVGTLFTSVIAGALVAVFKRKK